MRLQLRCSAFGSFAGLGHRIRTILPGKRRALVGHAASFA
jgi:hypothetical protein